MKRHIVNAMNASVVMLLIAGCGGGNEVGEATANARADHACAAERPCVSTVAGTGEWGNVDGRAHSAQFSLPYAVMVDSDGAVHVADYGNSGLTRKISLSGWVTTPADNEVAFPRPADSAIDRHGNRYVADTYNNRILKITETGVQTVLAGAGACGTQDGRAEVASFCLPSGLVLDAEGNLYVADTGNARVRKITLPAERG